MIAESTPHDIAGHLSPDRSDPTRSSGRGSVPTPASKISLHQVTGSSSDWGLSMELARRRSALLAVLDDVELATITHAEAIVSPSSRSDRSVRRRRRRGRNQTEIGRGSIVNTGAVIDHDGSIGRNVHLAPQSCCPAAFTSVMTLVGAGVTVQGIRIGARAVVGAGAVVLHDLPDDTMAVGVPARPVDR